VTVQKALVDQMKSKAKEGTLKTVNGSVSSQPPAKRRRWDVSSVGPADETPHKQAKSSWDAVEANTPSQVCRTLFLVSGYALIVTPFFL